MVASACLWASLASESSLHDMKIVFIQRGTMRIKIRISRKFVVFDCAYSVVIVMILVATYMAFS
jgi:hypothetical protein